MIPPFNEHGYLPPGVHVAGIDEIKARFGSQSPMRRDQMDSLHWLIATARRAGAERLVINGSFTTETECPNDVDCVLLVRDDFPKDADAEKELLVGYPFIELQLVNLADFEHLVEYFFATDRHNIPKGLIEVLL